MGNKQTASAVGKGDVHVNFNVSGRHVSRVLEDVLHVPDFDYSLVSVSRMRSKGLSVRFHNEKCEVVRDHTVVATGSLFNGLYLPRVCRSVASAHIATLHTW